MEAKLKTGIYSGSFNPVHIGHLALANWLVEFTELDELWFMITPQNPFKDKHTLMDDGFRLELVRRAIAGYPKFHASDFEFSLPRPSYTYRTLRALEQQFPDRTFYFIMGADNWQSVTRWYEAEQLLAGFPILIYPRKGFRVEIPTRYPHIRLVDAPLIEISSSFIRDALAAGKDVRFFLPEGVREMFVKEGEQIALADSEYISKEEVLAGIGQGLKEMQERMCSGKKAKTLDELIDEL